MKTNDYCIVKEENLITLELVVNDLINEGYIPIGNIYFCPVMNYGGMWFQAMIKKSILKEEK